MQWVRLFLFPWRTITVFVFSVTVLHWNYNLGQNKWNIRTTPPPISMIIKWHVFASSLLWGGKEVCCYYFVQDCSFQLRLIARSLNLVTRVSHLSTPWGKTLGMRFSESLWMQWTEQLKNLSLSKFSDPKKTGINSSTLKKSFPVVSFMKRYSLSLSHDSQRLQRSAWWMKRMSAQKATHWWILHNVLK